MVDIPEKQRGIFIVPLSLKTLQRFGNLLYVRSMKETSYDNNEYFSHRFVLPPKFRNKVIPHCHPLARRRCYRRYCCCYCDERRSMNGTVSLQGWLVTDPTRPVGVPRGDIFPPRDHYINYCSRLLISGRSFDIGCNLGRSIANYRGSSVSS